MNNEYLAYSLETAEKNNLTTHPINHNSLLCTSQQFFLKLILLRLSHCQIFTPEHLHQVLKTQNPCRLLFSASQRKRALFTK